MTFWRLPESNISSDRVNAQLPINRAKILHILGSKKIVDYELALYYKWIKISPKLLYRLQSGNTWFHLPLDHWRSLKIMDGKIISTAISPVHAWNNPLITWCIENPISLDDPDSKPQFARYISYKRKDYVVLSWQHDAIQNYAREDFILVVVDELTWLSTKKISHIEFASSRSVDLVEEDWAPVLIIRYANPDAPGWVYEHWEYKHEQRFNLWKNTISDKSRYMDYKTHWEQDVRVTEKTIV